MATDVVMAVEMKSRRLLFDEEQVVRVRQSFETLNADATLSINEAVNARNDNITFIVTITNAEYSVLSADIINRPCGREEEREKKNFPPTRHFRPAPMVPGT